MICTIISKRIQHCTDVLSRLPTSEKTAQEELMLELGQPAIPVKLVDTPTAFSEMMGELKRVTMLGPDTEWKSNGPVQR